jgi:hypothetical protein
LFLKTNDIDRVAVLPDGNVQIGQGATSITPSRVNASIVSTNVDGGIAIAQNSGVNVLLQASGSGGYIGTTSNHSLVFRTNDQDRMYLDLTGDLHVNGDVILANADCAEEFDVPSPEPSWSCAKAGAWIQANTPTTPGSPGSSRALVPTGQQ